MKFSFLPNWSSKSELIELLPMNSNLIVQYQISARRLKANIPPDQLPQIETARNLFPNNIYFKFALLTQFSRGDWSSRLQSVIKFSRLIMSKLLLEIEKSFSAPKSFNNTVCLFLLASLRLFPQHFIAANITWWLNCSICFHRWNSFFFRLPRWNTFEASYVTTLPSCFSIRLDPSLQTYFGSKVFTRYRLMTTWPRTSVRLTNSLI